MRGTLLRDYSAFEIGGPFYGPLYTNAADQIWYRSPIFVDNSQD